MWIGQPLCLWRTVSHSWMSTWLSNLVLEPDPSEIGGGKPSPGRLVPPLRKNTGITSLGSQIIDITSEFNQAVQMSISCGEKNHPFSDVALRKHSTMSWSHTRRWHCRRATLFPYLDLKAGERHLETQTGNTHLHSRKGFQLGWMNPL